MTVIAYKDGIMAADGSEWQGNVLTRSNVRKIHRGPCGELFACSGEISHVARFREWVLGGRRDDMPSVNDDFQALLVEPDGTALEFNAGGSAELSTDHAVAGAHAEFMHGAFIAGASAADVIRLAIERCSYAAGEIQIERLHR